MRRYRAAYEITVRLEFRVAAEDPAKAWAYSDRVVDETQTNIETIAKTTHDGMRCQTKRRLGSILEVK